jgi:class 3 adenylate cyclase
MTNPDDRLTTEKKYILVFDFCSSTSILEHLILEGHQGGWHNLLSDIEKFLKEERGAHDFEIYKFIGDGWILLFNTDFSPRELFSFLERLCNKYAIVYNERIGRILPTHIDNIGITFGLEMGDLIRFVMFGQSEYIGRPLNIAARLQGAIKDNDPNPQGKMLMSNSVYNRVRRYIPTNYKVWRVTRELKNVLGGEKYHAIIEPRIIG